MSLFDKLKKTPEQEAKYQARLAAIKTKQEEWTANANSKREQDKAESDAKKLQRNEDKAKANAQRLQRQQQQEEENAKKKAEFDTIKLAKDKRNHMDNQQPEPQKLSLENKQMQSTKKPDEKMKPKEVVQAIVVLLVIVLIGWFIYSVFIAPGSGAKYKATLDTTSFNVINPATLGVTFHVKNIGTKAGNPTCTIDVSDTSGTYNGTDVLSDGPTIKPGQTVTSADQITITKQGAQYVTGGTISCN